jgi:hypothetical protein
MLPTLAIAEVASLSSLTDEELKELASELHARCRGGIGDASETMMKFICTMRDESWDAIEKRGYCYKALGDVMFPKCDEAADPFPIVPSIPAAQLSATAEEVIEKTREAAEYLAKEGEKGIATFKSRNVRSFWKSDGYIFVIDCEHGKMLAHPILAIAGAPLTKMYDHQNLQLARPFCENGLRPWGGWFEVSMPKPSVSEPSFQKKVLRKILYVRPVPGTTYQVASGIYDGTVTVEGLNKLIDGK